MNAKLRCFQIKVEPDLFYRACDELGLMVIQDMPSLVADGSRPPNPAQQAEFQRQLEVLIHEHKNYPSIVTWVCFFFAVKYSVFYAS
jgi:beta-galactosidase/beta-glucuronidase